MTTNTSWAGWGIFFNPGNRNFSAYNSGWLEFWIYTNTNDIKVEMEYPSRGGKITIVSGLNVPLNQWTYLKFPLPYDLSSLYSPFEITQNSGGSGQ